MSGLEKKCKLFNNLIMKKTIILQTKNYRCFKFQISHSIISIDI